MMGQDLAATTRTSSGKETLLEARNLTKRYGSLYALNDVSFHVNRGEAVGVVGPNGAGKTTLFGALAGTFAVASGDVLFQGQNINSVSAEKRCAVGIARTYQVPRPFLGMTVFENVLISARAGGGKTAADGIDIAHDILKRTDLYDSANKQAAEIGLLDRKRLEVARAMATGPEVILLDEIGGGLTEAELFKLIELIQSIRNEGTTVVWIEHILHALLKVIDRLVCMAEGRVLAEGDPEDVMKNPEVRAAYLGSDPE